MKKISKLFIGLLVFLLVLSNFSVTSFAETSHSTVIDPAELEWNSITFGQSTDLNFSANVLPEKVGVNYAEPEFPGTIDGTIFMESRGGKLAPGHDGLTFYYTTLDANQHNFTLEADITFNHFGPETGANPNGQEGAGIMVRDVNGAPRMDPMVLGFEEVPAASNLFAVGLMRAGVSALARTGVTDPWGTQGSSWINSVIPGVPALPIGTPVKLKLERTDSEFIMTATFTHLENQPTYERRIAGADLVQVLDADNMQVGFYASRNAAMTVENARITLSEANTTPTPVVPPSPPTAAMNIVSPADSGSHEYELKAFSNYDGYVSIWQDDVQVVTDDSVVGNEPYSYQADLQNDSTNFRVAFTPVGAPSNNKITREITVNKRIFNSGEGIFVSPNGTSEASGTKEDPVDIQTAVKYVLPGETIFLRGGTYTSRITINSQYSGKEGQLKTIAPYNGEKVIVDGNYELSDLLSLNADYWHVVGFELTRSTGNGMKVNGSHNIIELMTFSHNRNSGFQISGSGTNPDNWPKYNLVLNSVAHDNRDLSDINADGFAAKLGVGVGNVFRGNIAHHNIDDGWDFYNRTNEGPNMPITLEGNIAYSNGKLSDGYNENGTSGSGFKIGGEGLPVAHIVKNNIAFDNNMDGFTDNFNPGKVVLENNTSFDNKRFNFIFRSNPYFEDEEMGIFKNNLSFRTTESGISDFIAGNVNETNFFYDGEKTVNSNGVVVDVSHFVSIVIPDTFARDTNGNILMGDFLKLTRKSLLNRAGENRGHVGAKMEASKEHPRRSVTPPGPPSTPPGKLR